MKRALCYATTQLKNQFQPALERINVKKGAIKNKFEKTKSTGGKRQ